MRYLVLTLALLFSTACSAQNKDAGMAAVGETLVSCKYKYDERLNVEFLERNKVVYRAPNFPGMTIFHITDTSGKKWAINQYDWSNYICTTTHIPKV